MHRIDIINQLNEYQARWAGEATVVERFIKFVENHPDCFERSLMSGHVTGSAWLVNNRGTHVLLTHHKKLDRWLQLGGHADGESDVLNVALREACEESGLNGIEPVGGNIFDIEIHLIPERGNEPDHFHYDVRYAFRSVTDESFTVSDESHDLSWVEIGSIRQFTQEISMLRMADKWNNAQVEA